MKTLLLILFILTTHAGFTQSDVPLYNSEGDATHYLDVSSNIIFSYRGDPASYLERNTLKDLCIYSFSGNHLGWYENGIVRSHEGKIVAFRKGAVTNVMVKMLPMKALPKMVPPKPIHGLYPMKPMFSSQFSSTDVAAFFDGSNTTNSKPIEVIKVTSNRSSTTSDQSFIPTPIFTPNFSALEESLLAGQRRYEQEKARVDNLIANGYVYDPQNNVYYSPENWETIRNARVENMKAVVNLWTWKNTSRPSKNPKNGRYKAYYMTADASYPIVNVGIVQIRNNKLKSMEVAGAKRTFKSATKISDWSCSAIIHDNFGFTRDRIEYPLCNFFIFEQD